MKSIVIITHGYPCKVRPIWLAFVREIAHALARQGVKVTVIFPQAVHRAIKGRDPFFRTEDVGKGVIVDVFTPRFLSLSSISVGRWNTERLTLYGFTRAVRRVLNRNLTEKPDALYGHFLYLGGASAAQLGREYGIPAFIAVGEGKLCSMWPHGKEHATLDLGGCTGYIPNSSELSYLLQTELKISSQKIGVLPNGIDRSIFYPRDQRIMRQKFGLPLDSFLVCCVGYFTKNKGPARVGEAIRELTDVGGVFLGTGPFPPEANNIVFKSVLDHDLIPEIMSACDVFVLPTIYEGCCSAILEAMSCGLPVISSIGAFNDDILNENVSIRIDPMDIADIRQAIIQLKENSAKRMEMSQEALLWAEQFCIDRRAHSVLKFMENKIADLIKKDQQ